jgi:hypothetical protein
MLSQLSRFAAWFLVFFLIPSLALSQRLTARRAAERTAPVAAQWASDAALIFVGTAVVPGMYADGTADAWACGYYSAMKDSASNFYAAALGPISFEPRPKEGYPSLQPIGASWKDSDAAGAAAESRGGRQFRNAHADAIVVASISWSAESGGEFGLWWEFTYFSPADQVLIKFKLDAGTFTPQPRWIVTQRQPATGANIAFVNSDDDTVAIVNLATGALDSIRLEVYAGLSPDTTGTKKAVQRYFNITAYPANASFTATLTLGYNQEEFRLSGLGNEEGLKLFRQEEATWQLLGGAADSARNRVSVSNVTKFSNWAIADPNDSPLRVAQNEERPPAGFTLAQNYPNPFSAIRRGTYGNHETAIAYQLPRASRVVLKIFDTLGGEIRTLVDEQREAGSHRVLWNGKDENGKPAASGAYLFQLRAGSFSQVRKMSLIR